MKYREFLKTSVINVQILLGKKTRLDSKLEIHHVALLRNQHYERFREAIFNACTQTRHELSQDNSELLLYELSSYEIKLSIYQRYALALLDSIKFRKILVLGSLQNRSVFFPLPKQWIRVFESQGFRISRKSSQASWRLFQLVYLIQNILNFFNNRLKDLANSVRVRSPIDVSLEPEIVIFGLNEKNLSTNQSASPSFVDWLKMKMLIGENDRVQHDSRKLQTETWANRRNLYYSKDYLPLGSVISTFTHSFTFILFLLRTIFKYPKQSYKLLVCIEELYQTKRIRFHPRRVKKVFFPNSQYIRKPIWVLAIEKQGAEVVFFHYAVWTEPQRLEGAQNFDGFWELANWNNCWVIDEYQKMEMLRALHWNKPKVTVTGVPFMGGKQLVLSETYTPFIVVFDTYIRSRKIYGCGYLDELGWDDPEMENEFIESILTIATQFNVKVMHKKKRNVNGRIDFTHDKKFLDLKESFGENYMMLDPDFSAESVINQAKLVISKPISTTGIIALHLGVDSFYYDPTHSIRPLDTGLRGMTLLHSHSDLYNAFSKFFRTT